MRVGVKFVERATFPNDVVLERVGDLFLLRCGDHLFDWGLYDWTPRWVYDADHSTRSGGSEMDVSWFEGRYLVPAEKIEGDFDEGADFPSGVCCLAYGGMKPTERPSWFREKARR